jgi:hypothetical protein
MQFIFGIFERKMRLILCDLGVFGVGIIRTSLENLAINIIN